MHARLKGINRVKAKLASGEQVTYYYHRATGTRLEGEPGTALFLASMAKAQAKVETRTAGTLSGIIRDFEKTAKWRKLAASTKSEYKRVLKFWENDYGKVPFPALEDKAFRREVLKWHDEFSEEKPREADNRVTILARVLSWATKDGDLKANVLDSFDRAYSSDRSEMIWLPEHVDAFMEKATPEMKLGLVLALHTGQRQGDLLALKWDAYDGTHIRLRQGKTRRFVTVKATAALKATLDDLPRSSTLILTTKTGRQFKKRYFAEKWEETCTAAKIADLHFHDIRGTTVTMLFQAGCNLGEIVAVTGHSLRRAQEILDRYLARTSTMADNAIAKFEAVLDADFAKQGAKQDAKE
ncbi:tyrosine-type recombinase/integrase [Aureimonas sp. ME7]|uniref:tyrosine-type recombinase/integrase n=1 Tax=Aureimonas sp. ME7 TaxID=2744252 RepID=UPI0015F3DDEF|nr:tyrosine-type recombinase/integrase [Aureimonas sp. ME7]